MKRKLLIINVLLAMAVAATANPLPSSLTFTYQWEASPAEAEDGTPLAPADHYQVWIQVDDDTPAQVATVADGTQYTLETDPGCTYRLRVCAVDTLGRTSDPSEWSDPLVIPRITDVPDVAAADLDPAYPNPFNPSTTLRYAVPTSLATGAPVRLRIHDARGALVRELNIDRSPGWHTVSWEGRDQHGRAVASGTYLAQYVCGDRQETTRLTLVK